MNPIPMNAPEIFSPWEPGMLGLAAWFAVVIGLIAIILFLTSRLGVKRDNPEKLAAYESGVAPTDWSRYHAPIPFYLVAVFFLIFDVEAVYVFSWAVAFDRLGWTGWLQMSFFIAVLLVSLVYVWRKGGLDWGPDQKR